MVYLPLPTDTLTVGKCTAQLLAAALHAPSPRTAVAEWVSLAERGREALRVGFSAVGDTRGYSTRPLRWTGGGGWASSHDPAGLLRCRNTKLQAALPALASMAEDD
jgi:hypothetical protein